MCQWSALWNANCRSNTLMKSFLNNTPNLIFSFDAERHHACLSSHWLTQRPIIRTHLRRGHSPFCRLFTCLWARASPPVAFWPIADCMKYYDQNGRVLSLQECRKKTENYREDLFRRVLTPTDRCLDSYPRVRATSAQPSSSLRSRSARSQRTRSAKVRRAEPLLTSPTLRITVASKLAERDRESPTGIRVRSASPPGPMERSEESSPVEPPPTAAKNLLSEAPQEGVRKVSKTASGLRIAVADFTNKVIDNQGMGIDTFTYLKDDDNETINFPEVPEVRVSCEEEDEEKGEGEEKKETTQPVEQRKVSIRSYQQYRSSVLHLTVRTWDLLFTVI